MDDNLSHIAFKEDMPGRVDLWPVIEKSGKEPDRKWFEPVDEQSETDHTVLMANQVADQIKHMIANAAQNCLRRLFAPVRPLI